MKKYLITGGCGYIGSHLAFQLSKDKRNKIVCYDNFLNSNKDVKKYLLNHNCKIIEGDIRNYKKLKKIIIDHRIEYVIHLAGLVGDPACKINTSLTKKVNLDASINFFKNCKKFGVKKFIFASTCSNYGLATKKIANENTKLNPLSAYAKTKVNFEKFLINQNKSKMNVFILRFATVFGLSERMRFDLTVNQFTRDIYFNKKLLIFAANTFRPYCHVKDVSRAIIKVINSKIKFGIYNVGSTKNNFSKKAIVQKIMSYKKSKNIFYKKETDFDKRDYRVSFKKIFNKLSFKTIYNLDYGIKETLSYLRNNKNKNFYVKKYSNT